MDLSIVIVSYRTPEHLRRCLTILASIPGPLTREVIVVDNDSGDASPDVARAFPGVVLIESGANLGYAGGVNRGLAAARGRYVLVMNPDVELRPGALEELVAFMDAHPGTGLAGPKLLYADGTLQPSCRRFYTPATILLRRTPLGRLFPRARAVRHHLMLDYDHAEPRAVDWIVGAAMIVRREALDDVGPMDERYFLYFEDVDWCTRMEARGWSVHYVPASVMIHHWQHASGGFGRAARTHLRSGLRFYERWGSVLYVLRQYRAPAVRALLVAMDLAAIVGAFLVAFAIRRELAFVLDKPVFPLAMYRGFIVSSTLVFLAAFAGSGLYRRVKEGDWVDVAFRVARASTLGALVVMASTFVLNMQGFSRVMVLGSWPLTALFAFLARRLVEATAGRARRERLNLRRVALVGADPSLDRLDRLFRDQPELGWEPVRIRSLGPVATGGLEEGETLLRRLAAERVHEAVLAPGATDAGERLGEVLLALRRAGIEARVVTPFLLALPPRARIERVGPHAWVSFAGSGLRPARLSKRLLDVAGALVMLVLGAAPCLLVVAGRALTGRRVLEPEGTFAGLWREPYRARSLAGGGWFRHYPLLPAVLRGTLSLVGPRPLPAGAPVPGGEAWARVRERHRPGIIGPWTLSTATGPDEEMLQELRYLESWTPETDLKILARAALRRPRAAEPPGPADPSALSPFAPDATTPAASGRPNGIMESRPS